MKACLLLLFVGSISATCPQNYAPSLNGTCTPCPLYTNSNGTEPCRARNASCPRRHMVAPQPCTQCTSDHWIQTPCSRMHDTVCLPCTTCNLSQYMANDCTQYEDRGCRACEYQLPYNATHRENCTWSCIDGFYAVNESVCVECPAGFSCVNSSRTACEPGTFQNETGRTHCLSCSQGFWQNQTQATHCHACEANNYCSATHVRACPSNTTSLPYSIELQDCKCKVGMYGVVVNASFALCNVCPLGKFCSQEICRH